jgi:hypothetical protein
LPVLFFTGIDITYTETLASPVGWIPLALFVRWLALTRRMPVAQPKGWATEQLEAATDEAVLHMEPIKS